MRDIRAMTLEELETLMADAGQPAYRAAQVFAWVHRRGVGAFEDMTDIPKPARAALAAACRFAPVTVAARYPSQTSRACKYLFALEDNTIIESVFMKHTHGASLCVSAQAGCRMGCAFCASGAGGLARNLTAGEMLGQVYAAQADSGVRADYIDLMGCGEPLDNFKHCVRFLTLLNHPRGLHLGLRRVTLSTCGLTDGIDGLTALALPVTLAVSLHAPSDAIRRALMPVARRYSLRETLAACDRYSAATGRRVTYEYALIRGVNDTDACARDLAALLKGRLCHVNLLRLNAVSGAFAPSGRADVFAKVLARQGINATFRRSVGGDVGAACGQLRLRYADKRE